MLMFPFSLDLYINFLSSFYMDNHSKCYVILHVLFCCAGLTKILSTENQLFVMFESNRTTTCLKVKQINSHKLYRKKQCILGSWLKLGWLNHLQKCYDVTHWVRSVLGVKSFEPWFFINFSSIQILMPTNRINGSDILTETMIRIF